MFVHHFSIILGPKTGGPVVGSAFANLAVLVTLYTQIGVEVN